VCERESICLSVSAVALARARTRAGSVLIHALGCLRAGQMYSSTFNKSPNPYPMSRQSISLPGRQSLVAVSPGHTCEHACMRACVHACMREWSSPCKDWQRWAHRGRPLNPKPKTLNPIPIP
jgi:hypothetical protein